MNRSVQLLFAILCCLAGAGCINNVAVEGAPCPCPVDGYTCCKSLSVCLSPGQECPLSYPPSSASDCTQDTDCPRAEICQAWLDQQETPAGPEECRHDCTDQELPCANGEVCEPVPADGRRLSEMHIGWACVPEEPIPGCEGRDCRQCKQVGATFCDEAEEAVLGCFLSVHPICGLTCSVISVEVCSQEENVCEPVEGGARCTVPEYDGDICGFHPCSECPASPGSLYCQDDDLSTCASVSVTPQMCSAVPCECTQVCIPTVVESCPGTCSPDGGAHCAP